MASPARFLPYVLPSVPGCPDFAANAEIVNAAIEFCQQTKVWKDWLTAIDIVAGTADYPIVHSDSNALIDWVEEVRFTDGTNTVTLTPMDRSDAEAEYGPEWESTQSLPESYTQSDRDTLTLIPVPDSDYTGGLLVRVSLIPVQAAVLLPDILFDRYAQAIGYGALSRLQAVPGKPWTNPQLSQYNRRQFDSAIAGAGIRAEREWTKKRFRTRTVL